MLRLQQLVRPLRHRQLGFKLTDPSASVTQLDRLTRRDAGPQAAVDQILVAPVIDRLPGDTELVGDFSDPPADLDKTEHLATELIRILPWHDGLLGRRARDSTTPTARNPGHTTVTDPAAIHARLGQVPRLSSACDQRHPRNRIL